MMTLTVGELLKDRLADEVVRIPASTSVAEAARIMSTRAVGAVLVMDGADLPAGIFSEREMLERVVAAGRNPRVTPLSLVTNRDPKCVTSQTSAEAALALMHLHRDAHLLVIDGPIASGMVSLRDLVAQIVTHGEGRYESTLRLVAAQPQPIGAAA